MEGEPRRKNDTHAVEEAPTAPGQKHAATITTTTTTDGSAASNPVSKSTKREFYDPRKRGPEKALPLFFLPKDFIPSLVPQAQAFFDFQALIEGVSTTAANQATAAAAAADATKTPHVSVPTSLETAVPSCRTCGVAQFESFEKQREHMKLDWHRYNLKQQLLDKSAQPISEQAFEDMLQDLASLSGSGSEDAEEDEEELETDGEDAYGPGDAAYLSDSVEPANRRGRGPMKKKKMQRRQNAGKRKGQGGDGSLHGSNRGSRVGSDAEDPSPFEEDDGELGDENDEDELEDAEDDKADYPRGAWEEDDPDTQLHQLIKKLELTVEKNRLAESQDPVLILQQQVLERQIQEAKMTPLIWFTSSMYENTVRFGVYKNSLRNRGKTDDILATLQSIQIAPVKFVPKQKKVKDQDSAKKGKQDKDGSKGDDNDGSGQEKEGKNKGDKKKKKDDDKDDDDEDKPAIVAQPEPTARYWTMILIGGGHFAGMIVDLAGTTTYHGRETKIIHHKTFHRYT
ncbi:hypothetical protein BGZ73_008458, partial [Actinomortierella ambigua]